MCAQELGKQNPQLFALITQNQGEFMRLLSEPANAAPANPQAADLAAQLAAAAGGVFLAHHCHLESGGMTTTQHVDATSCVPVLRLLTGS